MKTTHVVVGVLSVVMLLAGTMIFPAKSYAHCDTLGGPVVTTARASLENGDVTPLLKWVRPEDEKEIKTAFQKTLVVRAKGPKAKELADMYFFETLVRIHRAGEGVSYMSLKPSEEIDPAVALADKALESGNIDKLVDVLTGAMAKGIRERFHTALEKQKHVDESVAAGREFVKSYVIFTHYVEGLHGLIKGGAAHHHGEGGASH